MNRIKRIAGIMILTLLAVTIAPVGVMAQPASGNETVTILVDVRTLTGTQITGTITAQRQCGGSGTTFTALSFNGMVNGQPASASANGTETWSSNNAIEFELGTITAWKVPLTKPARLNLTIVQTTPDLISVNGVPVAIDGMLAAPCGGKTRYTVTNAGQSTELIVLLPKTGSGPIWAHPLFIMTMMVVPGLALIVVSSMLRKIAERRVTAGPK
jgi:hypothetical protein